jgi:hypothetical protein
MSEVRRSWMDKEHTRIRCYEFVEGRHMLPDVIAGLVERGIDWSQVAINYSATWEEEPTAEERQQQADREARTAERQEAWERETLVRLTEKYGTPA